MVAQAVVAGQAPSEVADRAVEPLHRRAGSELHELALQRRQLVTTTLVQSVTGPGDRVGVTRRHHAGRQRRVHLRHRRAHRRPLGDHRGLA
jgi:hypothetical protein